MKLKFKNGNKSSRPALEHKFIPLANLKGLDSDGPGFLEGYVSVFGNLDDGGDIVLEGAYGPEVIASFLKDGFTANDHIWEVASGEIGYPMDARADAEGLWVNHKFHSTPDAQNVRIKARERLADGKTVGLSIGYLPGTPIFISPKDYDTLLPKYVKAGFLAEALEKAKDFTRIRVLPTISDLAESSIVTRAMNMKAMAASVKSADVNVSVKADKPDSFSIRIQSQDGAVIREVEGRLQKDGNLQAALVQGATPEGAQMGLQFSPEEKIGARNSSLDANRIKLIHDTSSELSPEACPVYGGQTESGNSGEGTAMKTFLEMLMAKVSPQVKGMFESALQEITAPTPWEIYYALMEVVHKLRDLRDAGTDAGINIESLLDEALAAMVVELRPTLLAEIQQPTPEPAYYYWGAPPTDFTFKKILSGDLETGKLEDHVLAVETAVGQFAPLSDSISEAVAVLTERINEKQEFRIGTEDRAVAESIRSSKIKIDSGLQAARDKIVEAVEKSEGLALLTQEDLNGQMAKLKLQTERLRTNALAAN